VMAGFLQHAMIPAAYMGRVINIHPSLIPSFCGHGFYGLRVHQAAIDYGVKISGCTVHFVDNDYDHGPVILQRACPVRDDDTAESLQKRVFELECQALPEAIRGIALGHVHWLAGERLVRWHLPASMEAEASDR
jgi:phosphoribosylglycinamide formyltransferase 1